MGILRERNALIALFLAGLLLRILMVHPFGHLLGEDTYFHRDLVRFMIQEGGLAQFNVGEWETLHPYFLALSPKLQSYPFGYHVLLYIFAKTFGEDVLRYLPSVFTSLAPIAVYLFMKEFSGRGDIALAAAIFFTAPNVISYSVLLLPQSLGMLFLPLTLWLYLRTDHGAIVGAFMAFVHPFSCIAILVALFTLSLYRHELRKFLRLAILSALVVSTYSFITLMSSSPGSTFSFSMPEVVYYGLQRYISAFSVSLFFLIGMFFLKERREWYLVLCASLFGLFSVIKISNLPPERMFIFLTFFFSCIAAYTIRGFYGRWARSAFIGVLVVVSMFVCTDTFGKIGPSNVEVASWEFINEQTLDDAVVWGWDRYPQIYTTERKIVYQPSTGMDYICPEAHMFGLDTIDTYISMERTNIIYDNYVPIMIVNDN